MAVVPANLIIFKTITVTYKHLLSATTWLWYQMGVSYTCKIEMRNLQQELTILRVDHGLMDLRVKNLEITSHRGNEDRISLQNPSDDEVDETVNPIAEMEPEPSNGSFLQTISRINF